MCFAQQEQVAQQEKLTFAKRTMEVLPRRSVYSLMLYLTNAEIHMPKLIVTGQSSNTLSTIAGHQVSGQQWLVHNQRKLGMVNTVAANSSKTPLEETKRKE